MPGRAPATTRTHPRHPARPDRAAGGPPDDAQRRRVLPDRTVTRGRPLPVGGGRSIDPMGNLRVRRPTNQSGSMRQLKVRVDGHQVAALHPDEQAVVELDVGPHVVSGKMDWIRSNNLTVHIPAEGQLTVEVSSPFSLRNTFLMRFPIHARLIN